MLILCCTSRISRHSNEMCEDYVYISKKIYIYIYLFISSACDANGLHAFLFKDGDIDAATLWLLGVAFYALL